MPARAGVSSEACDLFPAGMIVGSIHFIAAVDLMEAVFKASRNEPRRHVTVFQGL